MVTGVLSLEGTGRFIVGRGTEAPGWMACAAGGGGAWCEWQWKCRPGYNRATPLILERSGLRARSSGTMPEARRGTAAPRPPAWQHWGSVLVPGMVMSSFMLPGPGRAMGARGSWDALRATTGKEFLRAPRARLGFTGVLMGVSWALMSPKGGGGAKRLHHMQNAKTMRSLHNGH